MNSLNLTAELAAEHARDLRRAAGPARLAALARCCRPSSWRRAHTQLTARLNAAPTVVRRALARTQPTTACCAGS
jgi:hypothetical protein